MVRQRSVPGTERARRASCTRWGLLLSACVACTGNILDATSPSGRGANAGSAGGGGAPGSGAGGAGGSGSGQARPISLEGAPIYTRFVRLTNAQWQHAVTDVLGLSAAPAAAQSFEQPVAGTTEFANNEHVLGMTNALWQSYQLAAEQAAQLATGSAQALAKLYPGSDAEGLVRTLGRRVFRRPLTASEERSYADLFTAGQALPGDATPFAKGAGLVIRGMLQSPFFLYRSELGDDRAPLSGYEVASKLSFWLLGTTPSDALLDAAAEGELDAAAGAVRAATEMLAQPAAAATMQQFHRELLHFDRYSTISKVGVPAYTPALNDELEQSSYRFFERIFRDGLGVRDILTSTVGYAGPRMARLYGVAGPASGVAEIDLGAARAGYFSQLPFLALYALNDEPDSIHRGVTLNLDILCADPGTPSAMLPPIPALEPGQTNRERITTLTSGCGQECHGSYINPLGFAFENFDGLGRARETDNGRPIDTAASYPFAEGVKRFTGAAQLMQIMAGSEQAHACYAKKLASYALQRDIVESDMPTLDAMTRVSIGGGSIKQVMLELVKDAAFRTRFGGVR